MAVSIPERIRGNPGIPKERQLVGGALVADLDEVATVWYEPPFDLDDARPHFLVLEPSIGVCVVMVFDQTEAQDALQAMRGHLRVSGDDEVTNPLERANAFGHELRSRIMDEPALPDVPVGGLAAFPHLHRAEAEALAFDSVIDLEHCLFRGDLDAARRGDDVIAARLNRALEGGLPEPLTDAQEGALRGILHPEVVITAPAQASLFRQPDPADDRAEMFRVMDRRQEVLAKGLGPGHRVIRGVAGSGKTLVLVARARLLARLSASKPILVTCYTRSLAGLLSAYLGDHTNVQVRTLHALMREVMLLAGITPPTDLDRWPAEALRAAGTLGGTDGPPLPQYRAVLIDEAQDFSAEALRFATLLAEESDGEQDVLVVADAAQDIYGRGFTWKDAGINARGRTRILRVNYRNTKEILAFAHAFLTADDTVEVDEAPAVDDAVTVIAAESAERSGVRPSVTQVADMDAELDAVAEAVQRRLRADTPARSIAVLYLDGRTDDRAEQLDQRLREIVPDLLWSNAMRAPGSADPKELLGSTESPVVLSTIHSAKGLEFPAVIVCGLGGRPGSGATRLRQDRRTLYVGLTRAQDELVVVVRSDDMFLVDIHSAASTD